MDMKGMGRFIAQLRKERGLTQAQLAEQLHLTDKAVSKWERGLSYPDISTLEPLAGALDISVGELIQGKPLEKPALTPEEADALLRQLAAYQAELRQQHLVQGILMLGLGTAMVCFSLWGYVLSNFYPVLTRPGIFSGEFVFPFLAVVGAIGVLLARLGILRLK